MAVWNTINDRSSNFCITIFCKIRISAHNLMIESGRYHKPKPLPREDRLCHNCCLNEVENEIHFLTRCSKYESEREEFYKTICLHNANFNFLDDANKALWLLSQEREDVLKELALYILKCLDKRNVDRILKHDK